MAESIPPPAVLGTVPAHIAIIMDGNGRWAASRGLPRHAGHKQGVEPVRMCVRECLRNGIGALTLFAWRAPQLSRGAGFALVSRERLDAH